MKPIIFTLWVVSACGGLSAQTPSWQPSPGHTQVPIWPGAVPDPQPVAGPEVTTPSSGKDGLIAGRPVVGVFNVTRPTMAVYSPQGNNTGAAVVVFPGGGYQGLAIDFEGTEVCDGEYPKSGPYPESPMALEDAQRTMGLVRFTRWSGISIRTRWSARVFGRWAFVGSDQHAFCEAFVSSCRCRRQRKLPPGPCGGYLSGTSVDCRSGMGC